MQPPPKAPHPLHLALLAGAIAAGAGLCWLGAGLRTEVRTLGAELAEARRELSVLAAEVTRFRIEQRAEGRGVQALLEKLATYAPLTASARVAEPDYEFARQEMDAVLRAFGSLGADAFEPVLARFTSLPVATSYDEQRWLLEALLRADPERGKQLVLKVLQGYHRDLPVTPRLRWFAADLLLRIDRPLAGRTLRDILSYESSRGIQAERAVAYQIPLPDSTAMSSGFHNFIERYVGSEDPAREETLLMVVGRAEHDLPTIQECVKALGGLKSGKAVKAIEKLYLDPPVIHENPLFLNHCLDALVRIQGPEACAFLQGALKKGGHELVLAKIKSLLQELGC